MKVALQWAKKYSTFFGKTAAQEGK